MNEMNLSNEGVQEINANLPVAQAPDVWNNIDAIARFGLGGSQGNDLRLFLLFLCKRLAAGRVTYQGWFGNRCLLADCSCDYSISFILVTVNLLASVPPLCSPETCSTDAAFISLPQHNVNHSNLHCPLRRSSDLTPHYRAMAFFLVSLTFLVSHFRSGIVRHAWFVHQARAL